MFERKSFMNWTNLESSVGFNVDPYDSNSKLFSKIKQESISYFPKQFPAQFEDSYPPYHPFNMQDTINFANLDRKNASYSQPPVRILNTIISTQENNDSWDYATQENISKKGLKNLSILVLRTIHKKQFTSHRQVAEQVQRKLLKSKKNVYPFIESDLSKEQKNIKRRTYDALNVMIAAGILQRQISLVKISNHSQFISRNYYIANKKHQHQQKLNQITSIIERKLQLLAELESKRNGLRLWIRSKKRQRSQETAIKIQFPLIFLVKQTKQNIQIQSEDQSLTIIHQNQTIYSQTDLIQQLYRNTDYFKEQHAHLIIKKEQTYLDQITYV